MAEFTQELWDALQEEARRHQVNQAMGTPLRSDATPPSPWRGVGSSIPNVGPSIVGGLDRSPPDGGAPALPFNMNAMPGGEGFLQRAAVLGGDESQWQQSLQQTTPQYRGDTQVAMRDPSITAAFNVQPSVMPHQMNGKPGWTQAGQPWDNTGVWQANQAMQSNQAWQQSEPMRRLQEWKVSMDAKRLQDQFNMGLIDSPALAEKRRMAEATINNPSATEAELDESSKTLEGLPGAWRWTPAQTAAARQRRRAALLGPAEKPVEDIINEAVTSGTPLTPDAMAGLIKRAQQSGYTSTMARQQMLNMMKDRAMRSYSEGGRTYIQPQGLASHGIGNIIEPGFTNLWENYIRPEQGELAKRQMSFRAKLMEELMRAEGNPLPAGTMQYVLNP